jgi:hypothetical protein
MFSHSDSQLMDSRGLELGEGELRARVRGQERRIARLRRQIRRLERLVLEQSAVLDLHSEAMLLMIQRQQVEQAAPEPTPLWYDSDSQPNLQLHRVG